MSKKLKNKSVKLQKINLRFLIGIFILCVSLVVSSIKLVRQFLTYKDAADLYSDVSKTALELQEGSDYLTEEARFFVLSGKYVHLQNYFKERNETRRREKAIDQLTQLHPEPKVVEYLNSALDESHNLEQMELYAMALVVVANRKNYDTTLLIPDEIKKLSLTQEDALLSDEYKIAKAWLILFSEDYMSQKHIIADYKEQALDAIFSYTEKTYNNSYEHLKDLFAQMITFIILVFVLNLLLFIGIILLVIRPLKTYINSIKDGEKLESCKTHELNILTSTYNEMYDKNEANEILLRHRADHDELTGLINRSAYTEILNVLETRKDPISFILIDVDFFKLFNDNFGHPVGDKILQRVASVLENNFRNSDYVARIGGDEFAVIMTDCDSDPEATKKLITTKMNSVKDTLFQEYEDLPKVTLSCGIEICNEGYSKTVYEHADKALYEIKRSGRNGFTFYSTEMDKIYSEIKID